MARAHRPVTLVAGYFDPCFVAHARRLLEVKAAHGEGTLVVAVDDVERPLLSLRARAEMVASLGVVDLVVVEPMDSFEADATVDLREEDTAWGEGLRKHVLARAGGKPRA